MQSLFVRDIDLRRNVTAIAAASLVSQDVTTWTALTDCTITAAVDTTAFYPAPVGTGSASFRYAPSYLLTTTSLPSANDILAGVRSPVYTLTLAGDFISSVFVKRAATTQATAFKLECRTTTGKPYAVGTFDVASDGVITPRSNALAADSTVAVAGCKMGVQAYANGWYRCWIQFRTVNMDPAATTLATFIRIWDTSSATVYRLLIAEPILERVSNQSYPLNAHPHPILTAPIQDMDNIHLPIDYFVGFGGRKSFDFLPFRFSVRTRTESPNFSYLYDIGGDPAAAGSLLFQGSNDNGATWTTITTHDIDAQPTKQTNVTTYYELYQLTHGTGTGAASTWPINPTDASGGNVMQKLVLKVAG